MEAANPKECYQVSQAGGDVSDYLLYGMAGYMLSSALNGQGQRVPVIVQNPNYHGYRRPVASYQRSYSTVRNRTVTTTTTKRGWFGRKTTTRTTTSYSRPASSSASSSRRSSSWGSSRSSFGSRSSFSSRRSSFSSRRR
jgi:hypothetical protein